MSHIILCGLYKWYLPVLPSCTVSLHFDRYSFPIPVRVEGWVGLGGWLYTVTGQLADTPTCGLDDSRTGHLADWSTRGLDNSRTGQVADWTTRGCHRQLCVLSFPFWRHQRDRELASPRLVQSASWLVRELSSPRVDQSARCPVRELAYPRVVQLPYIQR